MDTVVRYGERGVVEALVKSLVKQNSIKKFLQKINWVNEQTPDWINKVDQVTYIIEIGLSRTGFGDPDLILICESNGRKYFVIIEAKVIQYEKSAKSNKQGMEIDGYNSSINGQLSLKYRFIKACEAVQEWLDLKEIIEPQEILWAYQDGLNDKRESPRKLAKQVILSNILHKHGFNEASIKNTYLVALTWDPKPGPFVDIDEDIRPRFYDVNGKEIWEEMKKQVGWIGYGVLVSEMDLGEEFESTLRLMVDPYPEPTTIDNQTKATINTINWKNFKEETKISSENLLDLFGEHHPKSSLHKLEGSHSVKYRNITDSSRP